ncbi:MAG: histidine--tRNA ligase [Solirubrobacterales bacterium]|nr:histidine--tRNA ligase [Solirubrobacterales bacterium]
MIEAPKGTYDVLPDEQQRRAQLERQAHRILGGAGYRRIETPVFEATELFSRGVGESSDIVQKEMYTFTDAGGRSLTLRPEGTASVARAYIEHGMHKQASPVKLWYLSSFFRAEAPQKGRQRQFWQVGAELIGTPEPEADAELIILQAELLEAMGVAHTQLNLGSLGTPETRAEYREELAAYLRAHVDDLPKEVTARIDINPLRAFDVRGAEQVMANAPKLIDRLNAEDKEHFEIVKHLLDSAGLKYHLDPTLVRGLDYYTRTVFEFSSEALGAQSGVGGGGRYDGLIEQIGGKPTPASGWAAGIERILLAAGAQPTATEPVDIYVVAVTGNQAPPERHLEIGTTAFELASEARRAGLSAQLELTRRSVKAALKHADRIAARYVALVTNEGTSLKDMDSGEQRELASPADAVAEVLRTHRS